MRHLTVSLLVLTLLVLALVASVPTTAAETEIASATAQIVDAQGRSAGTATFVTQADGSVRVKATVAGFDAGAPGDRGLHIHTVGKCDKPGFTTAGGHFNPGSTKHGLASAEGPHAGDLPNIQFYADGSASLDATTKAFTLAALLDADGSAIVIHAGPDDYKTDPTGNSGTRIGCGIIVADK